MRYVLFAFLFTFCLAAPAWADGRAFPPDNCTTGSPFMAFTGVDGSNTFCNSGQDILLNALPSCGVNQQVIFDGSKFICEDKAIAPICAADQVLSYSQGGFVCVTKGSSVPTCEADQFLTYNGSGFQCANAPQSTQAGTWAGHCMNGWGGVDQVGTPIAPAYYDPAPKTGDPTENAHAASHGWQQRKGCSCPTGWTVLWTGTCDFGYCKKAATGGSVTGQVYMFTCTKNPS